MISESHIRPRTILLMIASIPVMSVIYWWLGTSFFSSDLSPMEYLKITSLLAVVIAGSYQLFFWTQKNNFHFKTRCFKIVLDDWIPFWPSWIWIYSLLYYVLIGLVVVSVSSVEQMVSLIFGGLILLVVQCVFFILLPCVVPPEWRQYPNGTVSTKFLSLIQKVDNGRNCMPSMHMSVATYVSLALMPTIGPLAHVFIVLIALSCLFVKQHQILDLIPGVVLGWVVYYWVL